MQIKRGIIQRPQKVVVYGPEGIGKSTFAAHFPDPLFFDVEGSTAQLDVARVDTIRTWKELLELTAEFTRNRSVFNTLVIDTVDWAERYCIAYICERDKKASIEDYGYGAGYTKLLEEFSRFLHQLDEVIRAGANVVLTAHAQIRKFEQPDEMGAYDRWELKLNKKTTAQTAALVKEWADAVLFANYKTTVLTDENNRKKAVGGQRVLYTQHRPAWDAKNRWGLAEELPFEFSAIAPHIPAIPFEGVPDAEIKKAAAETIPTVSDVDLVLTLLARAKITEEELRVAVAMATKEPVRSSIADYPPDFIKAYLIDGWDTFLSYVRKNKKVIDDKVEELSDLPF